jgi:hypothetical protein
MKELDDLQRQWSNHAAAIQAKQPTGGEGKS